MTDSAVVSTATANVSGQSHTFTTSAKAADIPNRTSTSLVVNGILKLAACFIHTRQYNSFTWKQVI